MRSSTVKVHMKTHSDAEKPRVIKIDLAKKSKNASQEEAKVSNIPSNMKEEKKVEINRLPSPPRSQFKEDFTKRPESRLIRPRAHNINMGSLTNSQDNNLNRVEFRGMKNHYSVSATITSSRDNVFDNSSRSPMLVPAKKKIPLMLPSFQGLGRREGCLLNRNNVEVMDKKAEYITTTLNILNLKIRAQESDQLFS